MSVDSTGIKPFGIIIFISISKLPLRTCFFPPFARVRATLPNKVVYAVQSDFYGSIRRTRIRVYHCAVYAGTAVVSRSQYARIRTAAYTRVAAVKFELDGDHVDYLTV